MPSITINPNSSGFIGSYSGESFNIGTITLSTTNKVKITGITAYCAKLDPSTNGVFSVAYAPPNSYLIIDEVVHTSGHRYKTDSANQNIICWDSNYANRYYDITIEGDKKKVIYDFKAGIYYTSSKNINASFMIGSNEVASAAVSKTINDTERQQIGNVWADSSHTSSYKLYSKFPVVADITTTTAFTGTGIIIEPGAHSLSLKNNTSDTVLCLRNKTITIQYEVIPNNYTVTYDANGGTVSPTSETKKHDVNLTLPTPTRDAVTTYPKGTITIDYNANGGSTTPTKSTGTYTNTSTTTYSFTGWNTERDGTGTTYNGVYTVNAAASLYAQWSPSTSEKRTTNPNITTASAISRADESTTGYTVSFDVNGGSSSHNSITSTRTIKYAFSGWNTNSGGTVTNYSANTSYEFSKDATLSAKWNPSYVNNSITLPTPTRTGYTFNGWATTETATSGAKGSYTPTKVVTLYATWQPNEYEISLDANGGSNENQTQKTWLLYNTRWLNSKDEEISSIGSIPERTGYTFTGYYTAKTSGTQIIDKDKNFVAGNLTFTTSNTTLYAHWVVNTVKIKYMVNGGTVSDSDYTLSDSGLSVMRISDYTNDWHTIKYENEDDPCNASTFGLTKTGYSFAGWKVWSTGQILNQDTKYASNLYADWEDRSKTTDNTESVVCYLEAQWTPIEYTISYTLNGGSVSPTNQTTYTIETNDITLKNPTKTDRIFAGWTGTDLNNKTMTVKIPKGSIGDRTYTANWNQQIGGEIKYRDADDKYGLRNDLEYTLWFDDGTHMELNGKSISWSNVGPEGVKLTVVNISKPSDYVYYIENNNIYFAPTNYTVNIKAKIVGNNLLPSDNKTVYLIKTRDSVVSEQKTTALTNNKEITFNNMKRFYGHGTDNFIEYKLVALEDDAYWNPMIVNDVVDNEINILEVSPRLDAFKNNNGYSIVVNKGDKMYKLTLDYDDVEDDN
jgi:uncharacterized repeat protein (TIGR02543 family)